MIRGTKYTHTHTLSQCLHPSPSICGANTHAREGDHSQQYVQQQHTKQKGEKHPGGGVRSKRGRKEKKRKKNARAAWRISFPPRCGHAPHRPPSWAAVRTNRANVNIRIERNLRDAGLPGKKATCSSAAVACELAKQRIMTSCSAWTCLHFWRAVSTLPARSASRASMERVPRWKPSESHPHLSARVGGGGEPCAKNSAHKRKT